MSRDQFQASASGPRADARAKAAGLQIYAVDHYGPDLLWAGVKRAGVPHAKLLGVDASQALALPGVLAVLTHRDVSGSNRQGVLRRDQPVLVDERVRHRGDAVALVVAESRAILAQALELVNLNLEELPGVFDPEEALAPAAPLLHADNPTGNLLLEGRLERGQGQAALAGCAAVVEADYRLSWQEHAYLETEAGWARLDPEGRVTIVCSTQTPFRDRHEVSEALGLDPARLRLQAPYAGGGFGGKDGITVQSLLALAALACPGRPVKMWWDRRESFLASPKRHPARLRYRLGADSQGGLVALEADILYDSGPYDHLGGAVMALGLEHAGGPYRIPHASLHARVVYTNNPLSGAFRGFGVPQVTAAMEMTLDLLASRLGLDPLEMRRLNAVRRGDDIAAGVTLTGSTGMVQCLETLAQHPLWRGRQAWKEAAGPFKRRGVGVAAMMHGVGYGPLIPDVAQAKLELTESGGFILYSGVVDMGQGNASTYAKLAAQVLGQEPEAIELVQPDTDLCLPSGSASASRTTYTFGQAVLGAARLLRQRIQERTLDALMGSDDREVALLPGRVAHLPSGRELPLAALARLMNPAQRLAVYRHRAAVSPQRPSPDQALALHGLPHAVFSYAAQLAAVEVDELTGAVRVERFVSAVDCGQILDASLAEQQVEGAVLQGLGYGLQEEFLARQGLLLTPDLATYILPTALDAPEMETAFVPTYEEHGPRGMKGVGEVPVDGPLPAAANALRDACGAVDHVFPLTPERVLAILAPGSVGQSQAEEGR